VNQKEASEREENFVDFEKNGIGRWRGKGQKNGNRGKGYCKKKKKGYDDVGKRKRALKQRFFLGGEGKGAHGNEGAQRDNF